MATVTFVVYGEPQGKQRARTVRNKYTGKAMSYTPERTVNYENLVKMEYTAQTGGHYFGDDTALTVEIDFYMQEPKSVSKKKLERMRCGLLRPLKKPDLDNCIKSVCDALNGVAYRDDAQVVTVTARKYYAERPRAVICIRGTENNNNGKAGDSHDDQPPV